jgi:hypothetical protein
MGIRGVCFVLLLLALLATAVLSQETTAGLQGTIRDPQGLVLQGATVDVISPALIGRKAAQTNEAGYYRFANLPPGEYTITVTVQGFRTLKQSGISLATGHLPTVDLKLELGTVNEVIEVSGATPLVDVATSKVQTNVTGDLLTAVGRGTSYKAVIALAPGARAEPMQGSSANVFGGTPGYQIDGAANAENSYLVEGQETAAIRTGVAGANVPMEFVQEVQVKSSGFEAEYGGAIGGVVNVIQKRGGNAWHGSVFTYYEGDVFDSAWNRALRKNPQTTVTGAGTIARLDQPIQYYQGKKDQFSVWQPGFEIGGYLFKDKVWVFASSVPELVSQSRTVYMAGVDANRRFNQDLETYFSLARIDYLAMSRIRVYGAWQYNYQSVYGMYLPAADDAYGLFNPASTTPVENYPYGRGYGAPNSIINAGGDVTITPNLISTTRFGYFYTNYRSRGVPVGTRYWYRDASYPYGALAAPALAKTPDIYCVSGATTVGCGEGGAHTLGVVYPASVHEAP